MVKSSKDSIEDESFGLFLLTLVNKNKKVISNSSSIEELEKMLDDIKLSRFNS